MDGPIITVDVSKGNCHYQPFLEKGKPLRKPKILYDTIEGFEELQKSIDLTRQKSEKEVSVVFEATGVYHRCLQKYLDDHDIPYYIISPLLSAKYRQTNLHANKTDALDCSHIAKAYYGDERLYVFEKQEERFIFLQRLNRMYEDELQHLRKRKVAFRSVLDIIYPRLDRCFSGKASLYDPVIMEILKKYPHPKLLLRHKEETITKAIEKKTDHGFLFVSKIVHKVYECALQCYSGCDIDDIEVRKLPDMAEELQDQMERCESLLSELVKEAGKIEYFNSPDHDTTLTNVAAKKGVCLAPGFLNDHSGQFAWIPFDCKESFSCQLLTHKTDAREIIKMFIGILKKLYADAVAFPL